MPQIDPSIRGMVLIGTNTIYASYMPTFTPPNDYQVVCQVILDTDAYHKTRARWGTSALVTFLPKNFTINELAHASDGRLVHSQFSGDLFFGRADRSGDSLGPVTVEVQRVLVFKRLNASVDPVNVRAEMQYIVVGREPDLFLIHQLTAPPDFDQLLTAQLITNPGDLLNVASAKQPFIVSFPGRENTLDRRLAPGEQVKAVLEAAVAPPDRAAAQPDNTTITFQVLAEAYLETEDLAP